MKANSTALALPSTEKLNKAVEPKPSKKEIIEAMTRIEHPRLVAEWNAAKLAHAEEEDALKSLVANHARKHAKEFTEAHVDLGGYRTEPGGTSEQVYGIDVRFDNIVLPDNLKARILRFHKLDRVPYHAPDIGQVRARIAAKMSGYTDPSQRVAKLLADSESRKVLNEMIAAINK